MTISLLRCAVALAAGLLAATSPAQVAPAAADEPNVAAHVALAPPAVLSAFGVAAATLQKLDLPAAPRGPLRLRVRLGADDVALDLLPCELRAPGYELLTRTAAGLVPVPAGPSPTWRGIVVGDSGSRVAATSFGGTLRALVRRTNGDLWAIQPLVDGVGAAAGFARGLYVVHRGGDALPARGRCGVVTDEVAASAGGPDSFLDCELALEADHPLFLLNTSSVAATQAEVLGVVNAVDVIYQSDLQIGFTVTQLIVDTIPDPYSSAVASTLLSQFRNQWNVGYPGVQRDVAHLFTGRSVGASSGGTVGFAYTGTVCDTTNAYALSETRWSANYTLRVDLTAHELGHTFGATHCDLLPGCSIMCSSIGGCGGVASFGPVSTAEIMTYVQTVSCLPLTASVPQISGASPVLIETVNPPLVTLTGSGFLGATQVMVGGQSVTSGIQVIGDAQLRFTPPQGLPLGLQATTVTNPAGTSNATVLVYRGADPCQVLVPGTVASGGPMLWTMGGWPNDNGYLGVSFSSTTSLFLGEPVLDNMLLLWAGPLDARGMATLQVPFVPRLLQGFTFYSQLLDESAGSLRSVSTTPATLIN